MAGASISSTMPARNPSGTNRMTLCVSARAGEASSAQKNAIRQIIPDLDCPRLSQERYQTPSVNAPSTADTRLSAASVQGRVVREQRLEASVHGFGNLGAPFEMAQE